MASSKSTIDIVISTLLKATGIDAAKKALTSLSSHTKSFAQSVGRNLANVQAGFQMVAATVQRFISVMSKGMAFERMTVQFKSLTGSMEVAKAHMKDLQDLGRTPPFSLEQFAAASQSMLKMTNGMVGFKKEMEIVGDMAAATGNSIESVGRAFGLAYQVIRDGQDFGRAGQMLYTMGVMSKKQVADFAEMSKAGEDNIKVWDKLCEVFGRYKGAMADTEKTAKGLVEAIQGEATVAMTDLSSAISESAKPALEGLLGYLRRINEDGTIEDWADTAVSAMTRVKEGAETVLGPLSRLAGITWSGIKGYFESIAQAIGNIAGTFVGGGSIRNAANAGLEGYKNGWVESFDVGGTQAESDADRRQERAARKRREREEKRAKMEEESAERQKADFDKAEKIRRDAKRASDYDEYVSSGSADTFDKWLEVKNKAEADKLDSDRKLFAEYQRKSGIDAEATAEGVDISTEAFRTWRTNHDKEVAQKKADEAKQAEESKKVALKAEAELHAQKIRDIQDEQRVSEQAASAAASRVSSAQTEFDRAFAMYRAADHGAAQIAEEHDYAADYKQLQKDARRSGRGWQIDTLASLIAAGDTNGQAAQLEEWRKSSSFTPEVESMVRAAAADQSRTTAEDELRRIDANTAQLAEKLDQLLSVKG